MSRFALLCAASLLWVGSWAQAQSVCASDGQRRPTALLERFLNADCESCWSDARTGRAGPGAVALDWIVPAAAGQEAPLSAAASADALARLESLGRQAPARAASRKAQVIAGRERLRVAHGLPFNGYLGASIELKTAAPGPWSAWLVLVETIPAGTEGTPIERNLVRNLVQVQWQGGQRRYESRSISIPEGARAERLRVVGWVQDAQGRTVVAAQSRCQE